MERLLLLRSRANYMSCLLIKQVSRITELPGDVCIVLKRQVFSALFQKAEKICNLVSVPEDMDFSLFLQPEAPADRGSAASASVATHMLVGAILHSGSADAGHYIAVAK